MPLVYIGGIVSSEGIQKVLNEGFDMIAIGRALIHDPDFIRIVKQNTRHISPCNHCNICVGDIENKGVWCPIAEEE
jgi:2,4-dienoyl-CoA reductase-like NADH-dependent reductase (Old Yellow Enzyme family)